MPALQDKRWTALEVEALQDADPLHRYQVVDGELLVTPGPRTDHQRCVVEFIRLLGNYLDASEVAELSAGPGTVVPDEYTYMQPDVFAFPPGPSGPGAEWERTHVLLAIEVLSPSTARFDRVKKRAKYQAMGAVYWIVDADARVVESWLPNATQPEILSERVTWHPQGAGEPFVLDIPAFFRKVFRER